MMAGEVRGAQWASIVASVGVNDSRRGTRGQLVGGTVEVQLAGIFMILVCGATGRYTAAKSAQSKELAPSANQPVSSGLF
jgi:hypothetical protein